MSGYSEKEMAIIKHYGFTRLVDDETCAGPVLYRMMAEKAFIDNDQGVYCESLRRCCKALYECKIYRNTEEWDNLIDDEVLM